MKPITDIDEFIKFCSTHTMKEIKAEYGEAGRNKIFNSNFPIHYKKADKHQGQMAKDIMNDVMNGMKQSAVARKYGVSRQYVSKLKIMEQKFNG